MSIQFSALDEAKPGESWQRRFVHSWPAYREWYLTHGLSDRPSSALGRRKIRQYMPELLSTYDDLCNLSGDDEICHRFLSLYDPPRLAVGCSQAVWPGAGGPFLIRNYDFAPSRWEAVLLRSKWDKQTVIGMVDCLWGLLDGVNHSGLTVSLAFGGDPKVGRGFAVPLIVRYLLETCTSVYETKDALRQIPSFMTYSLSILDRTGEHTTAYISPGRKPRFETGKIATNHQGDIIWPRYARFTRTLERAKFLERRLNRDSQKADELLRDFLSPPLYASSWGRGFGTLYTALYRPQKLSLELCWPDTRLSYSTSEFVEADHEIYFGDESRQRTAV